MVDCFVLIACELPSVYEHMKRSKERHGQAWGRDALKLKIGDGEVLIFIIIDLLFAKEHA